MPFRESSNSRLVPANARAADVATKAIEEITPIQQQKYLAAFSPMGFQCILYSRLEGGGQRCSCQGHRKLINSILGKDGKAGPGVINEMLTGAQFKISAYGSQLWKQNGYDSPAFPTLDNSATETDPDQIEGKDPSSVTSPQNPGNKYQGVFDVASKGGSYPIERVVDSDGFGDNGPVRANSLDEIVKDWDAGSIGSGDGCPVCFGTGIVGGFAPLYGWRHVITPNMAVLNDGDIELVELPWAAKCSGFSAVVTFPRGATALDTATLWNKQQRVAYTMTVDSVAITDSNVMHLCDGRPKTVEITVLNGKPWTHMEFQFNLGSFGHSARFEFPKQPKSSNGNLLEREEPFTIVVDPGVPQEIKTGDIITESVTGKCLIVGTVVPWNTRNRRLLGQELGVRVLQPQEYFNLLPRRGRVPTRDRTTNYLADNVTGPRRT